MYKCYDYNYEKVHLERKYKKEINQNNKCHVKNMGFLSFFHLQIFYDCVNQFSNYTYILYILHIYIWHQITHYHFSSW